MYRSCVFLVMVFFPALLMASGADKVVVADAQQASEIEADLQQNPENLQERGALMGFYANERDETDFIPHLLWMIDNHPESPDTMMMVFPRPGQNNSQEDHERIQAAWEQALAVHPDSPDVLYHAGVFIERSDPVRGLTLLRQAQALASNDPERQTRYFDVIAGVYSAAVIHDLHAKDPRYDEWPRFDPATANALRAELDSSTDPTLLSKVGTHLVQAHEDKAGLAYLQKAIDLDPSNPAWKQVLESAKAEPIRRQNIQQLTGQVQIGSRVADANLLTKVEPQYPPLAQQARVQGSVEFTVDISPDGHVTNIRLVRGHPLLVNAAKDAVLQYVYRPTLLNGKAVAVRTTVVVPFRLQ